MARRLRNPPARAFRRSQPAEVFQALWVTTEAQKHADIEREAALRAEGWEVARVVSHGIYRDPAGSVRAVAAALGRRGCAVRTSDEWRAHFRQLA